MVANLRAFKGLHMSVWYVCVCVCGVCVVWCVCVVCVCVVCGVCGMYVEDACVCVWCCDGTLKSDLCVI